MAHRLFNDPCSPQGVPFAQLHEILQEQTGEPLTLFGDPNTPVNALVHPRQLSTPEQLLLIMDPGALGVLEHPLATVAIVAEELELPNTHHLKAWLVAKRPRRLLATLSWVFNLPPLTHYNPVDPNQTRVHPSAVIDPTAEVDPSVIVGPFCDIGAGTKIAAGTILQASVSVGAYCSIGQDCALMSGVRIGDRTEIGNRVALQANVTIASDGFSYVTQEASRAEQGRREGAFGNTSESSTLASRIHRINSLGRVVIEDDVEIGANSCVDRATLGETRIGSGTKIDNLVQIAHNVTIGQDCLIVAQVGVAGSCKIGNRAVIAGQTGMADHLTIGDDAIIMAKTGLMSDVPPKSIYGGIPGVPRRQALQNIAMIQRLKPMADELEQLRKQVAELSANLQTTPSSSATPVEVS